MSGSASKRPRPSYEDGKAHDPKVQKMLDEAEQDEDGKPRLLRIIRRAIHQKPLH